MPVSGGADPLVGSFYPDTSVREDVSQIIYQPTPEDTPVYDITGNGVAQSPFHTWLTRTIAGRQGNANFEGFTYVFTGAMTYPDARKFNTCQILDKLVRVSESEVAAKHWAIDDAFADQMSIAMSEVKMDAEHNMIQGTLTSGVTSSARRMQGILNAIISGITTYSNVTAAASLTETMFNDSIDLAWNLGGHPSDVFCGSYMKRKVSAFVGAASSVRNLDQANTTIVNTVSVYQTDFFTAQMHLCRDIPRQTVPSGYTGYGIAFLDKTTINKMWLRPWIAEKAPKTADAYDGVIKGEFTIEWGHVFFHAYRAQYL